MSEPLQPGAFLLCGIWQLEDNRIAEAFRTVGVWLQGVESFLPAILTFGWLSGDFV